MAAAPSSPMPPVRSGARWPPAGSTPTRSTSAPSPATSTSPSCPTPTSSGARRGSSGWPTTCSGRRPTASWSSPTCSGPTSTGGTSGRRSRPTPVATVATAAHCPTSPRPERRAAVLAAGGAGTEDLERVADVGVAVLGRDRARPPLDGRALDLDGRPARTAHQVVVVRVGAAAPDRLTVLVAQHVDLAGVGERGQRAVDRREPQ